MKKIMICLFLVCVFLMLRPKSLSGVEEVEIIEHVDYQTLLPYYPPSKTVRWKPMVWMLVPYKDEIGNEEKEWKHGCFVELQYKRKEKTMSRVLVTKEGDGMWIRGRKKKRIDKVASKWIYAKTRLELAMP